VFTRKRYAPPILSGDWGKDGPNVLRSIQEFLLSLEQKGALAINEAEVTASQGIIFPATQVASSNANTLDDYEEENLSSAIALAYATPGTSSFAYTTKVARRTKIGRLVVVEFNILTSSYTLGTGTGILKITGLTDAASSDSGYIGWGSMLWGGITKAGYTEVKPLVTSGSSFIQFAASGSGVAASDVTHSDVPTGGTIRLGGSVAYIV
jgi:hypothetical protein